MSQEKKKFRDAFRLAVFERDGQRFAICGKTASWMRITSRIGTPCPTGVTFRKTASLSALVRTRTTATGKRNNITQQARPIPVTLRTNCLPGSAAAWKEPGKPAKRRASRRRERLAASGTPRSGGLTSRKRQRRILTSVADASGSSILRFGGGFLGRSNRCGVLGQSRL